MRDGKGSIIRIALEIDSKKAEADAIASSKRISMNVGRGLNMAAHSNTTKVLGELVKQLERVADLTERSAKSSKTSAQADLAAARAKAELARALYDIARAEDVRTRAAERAHREENRRDPGHGRGGMFAESLSVAGGNLISGAVSAAGSGLKSAVNEMISMDAAFGEVRKHLVATREETEALRKELLALATDPTVGTDFEDLAGIAAFGVQLGVTRGNLAQFTREVAYLGKAGDIAGEQGATGLAKLKEAMGLTEDAFPKLSAALVTMGENGSSTMSEILDTALRFASTASNLKLDPSDVLAYSSALTSLGQNAEAGGTAITSVFSRIERAVNTGGKSLERYAKIAGVSADEFARKFRTSPARAVAQFLQGLDKMSDKAGAVGRALDDLGIKEVRQRLAVQNLAKGHDLLNDSLAKSAEAYEKGTAARDKAEKAAETLRAKIEALERQVKTTGANSTEHLAPLLKALVSLGDSGVKQLDLFIKKLDMLGDKDLGPVTRSLQRLAAIQGDIVLGSTDSVDPKNQIKGLQARLRILDRAKEQSVKDGHLDMTTHDAVLNMFGHLPGMPKMGKSGVGTPWNQDQLMISLIQKQSQVSNELKALQNQDAAFEGERARFRNRSERERGPNQKKNAPPPPPGEPNTSLLEIEQGNLRKDNTLRDKLLDTQKKAIDSATSGGIRKHLAEAARINQEILKADIRLAEIDAAIAATRKDAKLDVIKNEEKNAKSLARGRAQSRTEDANEVAKRRRENLSKRAADAKKDQARKDKDAAEKLAKELKEGAIDTLESELQGYERTLKATEEGYTLAVKAIDDVTDPEGLKAAVARAQEYVKQLRIVGENIARKKKQITDKREGKETKASKDELIGAVGEFNPFKWSIKTGTLDTDAQGRNREIEEAAAKPTAKWSKEAVDRAEKLIEAADRAADEIGKARVETFSKELEAIEQELDKARGPERKALIKEWRALRDIVDDMAAKEIGASFRAAYAALKEAEGKATDPKEKEAIGDALARLDWTTTNFYDRMGGKKTVQGTLDVAKQLEEDEKYRREQEANRKQKDLEKNGSTYTHRQAIAGALGQAGTDTLDALFAGGKGSQALEESLKNSLREGVKDEVSRGIQNLTESLLKTAEEGSRKQQAAALENLKAGLALQASASALSALAGAQGGKKQGQAWVGALLGYGLSTFTKNPVGKDGKPQSDAGSLAELGINLATGNYLGAAFGLLGGKLKLPKLFASGGRVNEAGVPIIVGDGGRSEIFVPETPGFVLPDAKAAMSRVVEQVAAAQSGAGGSMHRGITPPPVNVYNNQTVYDRSDAEYIAEKERLMLLEVYRNVR